MNTLLHVFEGYAGLYQASRDPEVEKALRRILDIYEHKIYSPELHRQLVFFDQHYNSIIDLYSYGHDIESSWLIDWAAIYWEMQRFPSASTPSTPTLPPTSTKKLTLTTRWSMSASAAK